MEENQYWYIIGIGSTKDWEKGHGSVYWLQDRNGEKALPVFTTTEKAAEYAETHLNSPDAFMDMLEVARGEYIRPLREGHRIILPYSAEDIVKIALSVLEADYIVRDLQPGTEQEVIRLDSYGDPYEED